jgi:lipopolysaccharide transport system ATP-binding protein
MDAVAIRAKGLSKRYRIGKREKYYTLRDTLAGLLKAPLLRFRKEPSTNGDGSVIWALKDVSFEIKRGEVVGVIGRNGAGKTTLLKILSRITEPTEGYAEINGRVGSLLEVGTGFHPELTGRENIYLNGTILGMKKKEIDRRFDEIVAFAEVEQFIDTPVKHYSTGMHMRLAFAVAAHLETEILLVDEVLAIGDAAFQKKCLGKIESTHRSGRTVLFVSHNMTPICQLCTKAIWLDSGKIMRQGAPRDITSSYLRDACVPLGEACFTWSSNETSVAHFIRAYVMDERETIRPDIAYARPFVIGIEYQVRSWVAGLRVGIRLHDARARAVLHTATSDCPSTNEAVGQPGRRRVTVQLPGQWLAPGRYNVEMGLWSPEKGHHQHMVSGLAFDIIGAPVDSVGDEVLRPVLDWIVE